MNNSTVRWSVAQKILFRFFACFFSLYIFGGFLSFIFRIFVPWFAVYILKFEDPITVFTNGSGDTTYDYVTMFVYLLLAFLSATIWSIIDRKREDYQQLLYWVSVVVRYYLVMNMFIYGFYKIFHLQMPSPVLSQLIQPLGDKSPMGLAWTYIGFSKGFSFFTGFAEVTAGFFLLFRRTVTFGALLTAIVTINILAINLFFDVPVKLFSFTLFLMSLFLLAPDLKRLINFFLLNKQIEAKNQPAYLKKRWLRVVSVAIKCLFVGYLCYNGVRSGIEGQKAYGDKKPKPALYGLYDADVIIRNNDTIPPLITDASRWRNLVIQWEEHAMVKMMNDSIKYLNFTIDTTSKTVLFYDNIHASNKNRLTYQKEKEYLTFSGIMDQDSVYMRFKERDIKSFKLMNTGFRWVNEYPDNR